MVTLENATGTGKEVLPESLTLTGAIIQLILVIIFIVGPAPFLFYISKLTWKESVKAVLYAGFLSFLLLLFLNPMGPLAVLFAFPVYMWALKIRLNNGWREALRLTLVIWGVLLLPLLLIGSEILQYFIVSQ
ncbi:MAG: hypothetical protein F7B59_08220 [Desulfurococcales archaeon]|nr:hypothetical protein [Desulfurococcales archaeon]